MILLALIALICLIIWTALQVVPSRPGWLPTLFLGIVLWCLVLIAAGVHFSTN